MTQAEAETFTGSGERLPVSIVAMPSDSSPLVDVSFLFHSGAASDPDGKKGLASLTASMLTEAGSATWSIQEINDAMYPIASGFYAQVDKEMTTLSGQVHKDNLDTWYRYVRSQLLNPGWRESDFERVKTQLNNEIRTDLVGDNDEELGKEVMYSSIYGDSHPYGSLNEGHSSDVANLTLDDVRAFYSEHFSLSNLSVGLAGGFPASFVEQLGDDLQSLPAGSRNAVSLPALPDATSHQVTIVEKETSGVAVSFGFPIELKRGDPDWVALWLARSWLGEHRSENSHLYQRIREARGMNYGNYAYVEYFPEGMDLHTPPTNLGRQHQVFQVWLRPLRNNNDAHFATRAAIFEMDKLIENGMSETEFETTRAFLSKSVSLLTDGQSRQLGYELDSRFYEIEGFSDYVRSALDQLTLDDVNRVIRENLKTDNMHFAFVTADAADLADRLVNELASPMAYDTDQSDALLAEDAEISGLPLDIGESDVEIIQADEVFR